MGAGQRKETAKAPAPVEESLLTEYYSAAQLRADRWSSLKNVTSRLVADPTPRRPARVIAQSVFFANEGALCKFRPLEGSDLDSAKESGVAPISHSLIVPCAPGFPILLPGQVISPESMRFMRTLNVMKIHG